MKHAALSLPPLLPPFLPFVIITHERFCHFLVFFLTLFCDLGLPEEKIVESHGTFAVAYCVQCGKEVNKNDMSTLFWDVVDRGESHSCVFMFKKRFPFA